MKVMLLVPPGGYYAERWSKGSLMPPLGLGYLAAVLEENDIPVEVIDAYVEGYSLEELGERLEKSKPDIVGITITTENRFEGFDTAVMVKETLPRAIVVAGGPHISLAAEDTLRGIPQIDLAVRGEGEYTLLDIVRAIEAEGGILPSTSPIFRGRNPPLHSSYIKGSGFENIAGLSFRRGNDIIHNPPRPPIRDLDSIPFPARHLFPWDKYNFYLDVPGKGRLPAANIITSRGCPFSCNFCASSSMWGRRYRTASPERVIEEIELLKRDYKAKAIWFFDDTFNLEKRRTEKICDLMIERSLNLYWYCEIRVDILTKDLLAKMKEAGCYCVAFGVESGSQRILDEVIGKGINIEQARRTVKWCRELGLLANPFFILSHPSETIKEAEKTMSLIREFSPNSQVSLSLLHVYPGTKLEETAKEKGIIPPGFSWTDRNMSGVITLPSSQGNVPLFIDQLTWEDISHYLFKWASLQNYSVLKRIPQALKSIRNWDDFRRYWTMFRAYVRHRLGGVA